MPSPAHGRRRPKALLLALSPSQGPLPGVSPAVCAVRCNVSSVVVVLSLVNAQIAYGFPRADCECPRYAPLPTSLPADCHTLLFLRHGRISGDDPEHCDHRVASVRIGRLAVHELDEGDSERPDVRCSPIADTRNYLPGKHAWA